MTEQIQILPMPFGRTQMKVLKGSTRKMGCDIPNHETSENQVTIKSSNCFLSAFLPVQMKSTLWSGSN